MGLEDSKKREKERLIRFGVSMPEELMQRFDALVRQQGYGNRSEALRDLVRKALVQPQTLLPGQTVAGTIVIVYNHHASDLVSYLIELQHEYLDSIISTMHIHLNHEQCLEIIVVRGVYERLRELHHKVQVHRGIHYAELSVTHADPGASV